MSFTFGDLDLAATPRGPVASPLQPTTLTLRMADGVELIGDLFTPAGDGPWPVIVERTPYGAAALAPLGACYAAQGYLFLAVDVRGRYRSAGVWEPLAHEKSDGPEVLRQAAHLLQCDGRVGTRGHSYSAANQLLAAPYAGPVLKAMVVHCAPADAFDNVPFQGGAYELSDWEWAWRETGPVGLSSPDDEATTIDERMRAALGALPLVDADVRMGLRSPHIRQWLKHWRRDAFWRTRSWLAELPPARVPTLHVSGHWDNNGRGSVLAHRALGGAAGGQRLLFGPWNHHMTAPEMADLPEHEQALIARAAWRDVFTDELAWFDQHLKGQPARLPAAEVFVTGAWQWIEAADWPPAGASAECWYLGADGGLGRLPAARGRRQYEFDPAQPNTVRSEEFPVEPRPYNTVPDERADVLVYRSPPLTAPLLTLGDVQLIVRGSTTATDCDWVARLVDEYPDGRAICIRDGIIRGRFRAGFERPRLIPPGKPTDFPIDLWHVAHEFRAGHRVRVEICSSAHGRWDVNPQDGGELGLSTATVRSTQTVLSGGATGTRLVLPVCAPAAAAELLCTG